jgi:hypothetical protein
MGKPHRKSVSPLKKYPNSSEFYMNCAPVVVVGKAGSSFTGPQIFEANIFGQGKCNTVEGVDVVYPNPGPSVQFGGSFVGGNTGPATVLANCDFDQNVMLTTTGGTASASAGKGTTGSNSTVADPVSEPAVASVAPDPTTSVVVGKTTQTTLVTVTAAATPVSAPVTPAPAVAPVVNDTGAAAGTACSPDGSITCAADGLHWSMCDQGVLVDMGSVAAGTTCADGTITRKRGLPPHMHRRHGHKFGF